jgi:hypothetical protein
VSEESAGGGELVGVDELLKAKLKARTIMKSTAGTRPKRFTVTPFTINPFKLVRQSLKDNRLF